ncbi:hypothetical protein CYLTODRAFT_412085 [Cylindrobasidium torrendii FP15055 ss-10]|uniref:Uncharacterized protein n=1 Tax=Cylindrobasidium torrendii FP15055 ss-10 TaxID=1314674 RepID=A0A0D7B6H2_9AGAR|nr:hypothetical protein CYLTODRAFT_412085 [Cylindrobasidium torrendii FP15055 ss-10]
MLLRYLFSIALAAVSIAAPTPAPAGFDARVSVDLTVVRTQLDTIFNGLGSAYHNWLSNKSDFGHQQALCSITTRLNSQQTATLQKLNVKLDRQCRQIVLRSRLNDFSPGFGDAWWKWYYNRSNAGYAQQLCDLATQLSLRQRNSLLNLGVDVDMLGCRR